MAFKKRRVPHILKWDGGGLVKWWESLESHCCNKMAPLVDDSGFCNLASIGFLPFSQSLKYAEWREILDPNWRDFCLQYGIKYDQNAFHVACSTHEGVNNSVKKYDKKYPLDLSEKTKRSAIYDCKCFFNKLENKCPIIDQDDIMVNPDAVTGVVATKWFGIKKKEEAVHKMLPYCDRLWEEGHKIFYPWLWKQAGKVELLKIKKLLNCDIRGFTIVPFEGFTYAARMCQSLNEAMCDPSFYNTSPIKHGVTMSRGGFRMLLRELLYHIDDPNIIEGDCVKWDSGMIDVLFEAILEIRFHCWDKKGMSVDEWWERMRYIYSQIRESYICLTTGQIVQKMFGNPSGQNSTTDDNCIGHLFVLCCLWRTRYGRSLYADFRDKINIALYADDHIIACNGALDFSSFDLRQAEYRKLGCDLDKEKDFVSKTFENHTFLGLTMKWHATLKTFVPHFSGIKALNTLEKYEKNYTVDQVFDRAITILLLVSFDDETYSVVKGFLNYLQDKFPSELFHRKIPSLMSCHAYWLCQEGFDNLETHARWLYAESVGGLDGDKKTQYAETDQRKEKGTCTLGEIRRNYK